ncbi:MAG TPA: HypC/HybG/HupF family hydrogenase formation chaperone [Solirubrobacterales bacterium]|nr:HypC/HybG/HupF family hydrogenase formation chaperone [Solirubrobacterales bacterium]
MTPEPSLAACDHREGCITCGDEALPLTVLRIDEDRQLALCEAEDGRHESVEIALVTPVARGDVLLVHAGTAIAHLDRAEGPA